MIKKKFKIILITYFVILSLLNYSYIGQINDDFLNNVKNQVKKFESIEGYNIYFVKTHKTASSALQNVLIRLADKRNMRVVNNLEQESQFVKKNNLNNKIFFIHGRHNSTLAENVFPRDRSLFMTILRNPADQLMSSINYFRNLKNERNNLFQNIKNQTLMKMYAERDRVYCLLRNSASYDLGIVNCTETYKGSKQSLINRFKQQFDFVILTEYFNEGLILLKKILNLSYKDIVCLSVNQGTKKVDEKDRQWAESIIEEVSNADVILYNYYLKKYKKLRLLLSDELCELKRQIEWYQNECTDGRQEKYFYGNVPFVGYVLRKNITSQLKDYCWKLITTELDFLDYINQKSKQNWGI